MDLGIDNDNIINSLKGRKPTKYAAIYYLLLEKLSSPRKSSIPTSRELRRCSVDAVNLQRAAEKNR